MIPFLHSIRTCWIGLLLFPLILNACSSGHAATGYDDPARLVPYMNGLRIDGDAGDWQGIYPSNLILSDIYGNVPDTSDLLACFRMAWNEEGLFVLAEIHDDSIVEDPSRFWNGDGIELFISPRKGSFNIIQISVRPSYDLPDSLAAIIYYDHRRSEALRKIPPVSFFCCNKSTKNYTLEGRIPLDILGIAETAPGMEMAVQVYINDADMEEDTANQSLPWYPVRDSYRNPYAFYRVRFSESVPNTTLPEVRAYLKDDESLHIKVLSDHPCPRKGLEIRSGHLSRQFHLQRDTGGIYTRQLNVPYKKFSPSDPPLRFFCQDSFFLRLDPCMLQRVYEDKPKPNRFEDEIRIFEIMDHFQSPTENSILFTGSSTIREWFDLESDLPGLNLLNRGFGGSTMQDLNYYLDRIVFPYNPSKIFVYEGDNDIARGADPQEFIHDCLSFIQACQRMIPETEIYFLSIKPSPARMRNWEQMQEANRMLFELAGRFDKVHYIDISADLFFDDGRIREDLYKDDRLHFNALGYETLVQALWLFLYE